jgi:hypothetical protein
MDAIGIEANIQQAIMDPKFKSVKLTETPKHWLKESKIVPGGGYDIVYPFILEYKAPKWSESGGHHPQQLGSRVLR